MGTWMTTGNSADTGNSNDREPMKTLLYAATFADAPASSVADYLGNSHFQVTGTRVKPTVTGPQ